jgi:type III restriction enzyme
VIQLFDFQVTAAAQMAERFSRYMEDPPLRGTAKNLVQVPFYQALHAITASGKTAILAEAVARMQAGCPLKPIVLWLSTGRVVVEQTYVNLSESGKYHHLLGDVEVKLLSECDPQEMATEERALIYFATVGTFNQKDKEKGDRLIFRSEIDTAETSTWEALKLRETAQRMQRPLLVVYDEGHNLSDQQTDLLVELQPTALLLASATMKLPANLGKVLDELRSSGWTDDDLTTLINPLNVAESGLIKRDILMGGYQSAMETTVNDLLSDLERADEAASALGLSLKPKAIYVSKTNIKEGNSFQADDPKRPFGQREAPPILIWRHLVEQKAINPETVVVYADVKFDKNYPPPSDFVLLKGGDADFTSLVGGPFRHIIFNLRLQEGWDDPSCYFAYIDKSMGSRIQVQQIIGRLLRQPEAKHYESETLNTAHFYVRVDAKNVFADVVNGVRESLKVEGADVALTTYAGGTKSKPVPVSVRDTLEVPHVFRYPKDAVDPIQEAIDDMTDYRSDSGANVRSVGSRALVRQRVGDGSEAEVEWVTYEAGNTVSARWVFQLEVARRYPAALEVCGSDNPKFDARIELGSRADKHFRELADKIVALYLVNTRLRHGVVNPYVVGPILTNLEDANNFKHALHASYSGLNKLELPFAEALDAASFKWARNAARSGFGIPLITLGQTKTFYPDFLVWKDDLVFALDTTGEHLLQEKLNRKLLAIDSVSGSTRLFVRLISKGTWKADSANVEQVDTGGFTVWSLGNAMALKHRRVESIEGAVAECVRAEP